jgi:putative drug exporter of the RND superfamily
MRTYASWITAHRKIAVITWILVLIGTGVAAGAAGSDFKEDFKLPKSDSGDAVNMLKKNFPAQSGDSAQIVVHSDLPGGVSNPRVKARVNAALAKIRKVHGVSEVVPFYGAAGASTVSPDGKTAFATVNWDHTIGTDNVKTDVDPLLDVVKSASADGIDVQAGGNPIQQAQQQESGGAEGVGIFAAGIVLFIMFGTFLAMGMPIATAVIGVATSISLITLSSHIFSTADFATFLAIMIGLGVGIDYSLFIVSRFRQGLREGIEPRESVIIAMDTAGRAVLFAGITVVIALLGLFAIGVAFLYGPAVASSLTVLLTMTSALTLLPAVLTMAGHRLNDPFFASLKTGIRRNAAKFRGGHVLSGIVSIPLLLLQSVLLPLSYLFYGIVIWLPTKLFRALHIPVPSRAREQLKEGEVPHPRWHAWSAWIQRHPWPVALVATTFLLTLAIPAFSLSLGVADSGTDPADSTTKKAYDLLAEGFGAGFNGPLTVVVANNGGPAQLTKLTDQIKNTAGIAGITPAVVSPNKKIAIITAYPTTSPQSTKTKDVVDSLRSNVLADYNEKGTAAHIAGVTAIFDDFSTLISKKLPLFIGAVVLLSALLLMAVFRSLLIPIKAVIMNLLGILAAFGVVVAIFQWGWGASLIGVSSTAPIIAFLPVMVFAIVFGLSMDYEVFLMSRVHEEWERSDDAEEAVVEGLAATGGVITAAAIIMISLFASFAVLSNDLTTKLFGVALATTIFLDAFIIRSALVPAVMAIMGRRAWWLPDWLGKVLPNLNVEPPPEEMGAIAGGSKPAPTDV